MKQYFIVIFICISIIINDDENIDTEYFKSDYYLENGEYDHKSMRQNSEQTALQAAIEGTVLLWNNEVADGGKALPLEKNSSVSLFGNSSINYGYLGLGSGNMFNYSPKGNFRSALQDCDINVNTKLNLDYISLSSKGVNNCATITETPWSDVAATVNSTLHNYNDAAIVVLSRICGEGSDMMWDCFGNPMIKDNFIDGQNSLELTVEEEGVLAALGNLKKEGKLKKIILVLNTANAMQFKTIQDPKYGIDACLYAGLGGQMSFYQLAHALTGTSDYVVSGHLADILVKDNFSAPANVNMGDFNWLDLDRTKVPDMGAEDTSWCNTNNEDYIVYQEGIYVGYKYYETRYEDMVLNQGNASSSKGSKMSMNGWKYSDEVSFPFGYGASYTDFEYSNFSVREMTDDYRVTVDVKNVGSVYVGKDAVQVYLQKPYTDYDKQHNIEKSSIELVGFEKTRKLAPGESQTITIDVSKESLKTYDAYGEKTYILEQGDYYLSVGTDSHDALNNILAKKGKTTSDGMDYNGNSEFVYKISNISHDDFLKYSKSTVTGYEITNQFDDTDINLYEGTKDQKITYLSRNDWNATYPIEAPKLRLNNDKLYEDIQYGHEITPNPEDEMPLYETVTTDDGQPLSLIMLKDLEYDHPYWEDLLNQMTQDEQEYLMSYGLHYIAGAASVGAPGCFSKDGPAGIKQSNPGVGSEMAFPSETLLAQTFDRELVNRVGKAFGLEILHVNYNVIYGPGACIHRSQYSGRNWEYFSEDGYLTGELLTAEVTGLQEKGVIVMTKHFALNDQESNRYGVATFANEQSIREIYLKGFEAAVVEGRMNGVMSSFNRIGLTWAGAHRGLLTEVLRKEWNFIGIVESDAASYVRHMTPKVALAEGLVAGNDLWMDSNGSVNYLDGLTDNPTVMLALREACHRILYTQLHSNAMNGVGTNTKIIQLESWWITLLNSLKVGVGITMSICLIMAIVSFILASGIIAKFAIKRKLENGETVVLSGGEDNNSNAPNETPPPNNKILIGVLTAVLLIGGAAGIIVPSVLGENNGGSSSMTPSTTPTTNAPAPITECEHKCDICGYCVDLLSEEDYCKQKCTDNRSPYVVEAETAAMTPGKFNFKLEDKNGRITVGNINENTGGKLTYYVNSTVEQNVSLVVTVCRRSIPSVFTDIILLMVNDKERVSDSIVPGTTDGTETWHDYVDVNIGCVELNKGENVIEFIVAGNGLVSGYNFDKFSLYGIESSIEQFFTKCEESCPICEKCLKPSCNLCVDKCSIQGGIEYKFEAEDAVLGKGQPVAYGGMPGVETNAKSNASNGQFVGNLSQNIDATITFSFRSDKATTANLKAAVIRRVNAIKFTDAFKVIVNGVEINTPIRNPASETGKDDWFTFFELNLGCINLVQGENTIVFKVASRSGDLGINFDYIKVTSTSKLTQDNINHECDQLCDDCGKCIDIACEEHNDKCLNKGVNTYRFDAVDAELAGGCAVEVGDFVGNTNSKSKSITFKFNSNTMGKASLTASVSQKANTVLFKELFTVKVNGVEIGLNDIFIEGAGSDLWFDFIEVGLGCFDLIEGENEIVFNGGIGSSFDHIMVNTDATINNNEHTHHHLCPTCNKSVDMNCRASECVEKCEVEGSKYEFTPSNATLIGTATKQNNDTIIGNLSGNIGAGVSYTFNVESETTVGLSIELSYNLRKAIFSKTMDIMIDGNLYESSARRHMNFSNNADWNNFRELYLGCVELTEGEHTISFITNTNHQYTTTNIKSFFITSKSIIS